MSQGGKGPYGIYGVFGTLAYDFKSVGNEKAGDYGNIAIQNIKRIPRRKKHRSPAVMIALIFCLALLVAGLISQSSLVSLSDETYALRQEIDELQERQIELKIQHAMSFPLFETENYAENVLGMQKLSADQLRCVTVSETEIQQSEETTNREAMDFWAMLREYFPG